MTDPTAAGAVPPSSLARNLWIAYGQKALTILVTAAVVWLVSHNVLPSADQQQAVTVLVALGGYGVSVLWTQYHERDQHAKTTAAVATAAATGVVPAVKA